MIDDIGGAKSSAEPADEPITAPASATSAFDAPNAAASLLAKIDECAADHFPGSAVARTTEAWNVVHHFLIDLKQRVSAHLGSE